MLERKDFYERLSREAQKFFLRVMIGALILYDHIDINGAFCRQSPIDIRAIVHVIKQAASQEEVPGILHVKKINLTIFRPIVF